MPVPIAPVNRQSDSVQVKFRAQSRDKSAGLVIDWALATERVVVFGYFEKPSAWNIASAGHIFEERKDIFGPLGAAE